MKLFIELCSAKASWLGLDREARRAYLSPVGALMQQLEASGAEIVAWGCNEAQTPERAPYDFFGVFKFPDGTAAADYERVFRRAGWYDYFEQVNVVGDVRGFSPVLDDLVGL